MKLLHTTALNEEQKNAVLALTEACKKAEPISLSAALEDGIDYFLSYGGKDDGILLGYSFLFFAGSPTDQSDDVGSAEFMAFVHPAHRRKGIFTGMLNEALACTEAYEKEHHCEMDFYLLSDQKSEDADAVLALIGAEYWYSEYTMTRGLTEKDRAYQSKVQIQRDDQSPDGSDLYIASLEGQIIGTCAVILSGQSAYLYSFQIKENFQSQGHGKDFLLGMLSLLASETESIPEAGDISETESISKAESIPETKKVSETRKRPVDSVSVQVSGLNYIARNLYKKTGFRTADTLSYYIY